MKIHGTEVRGVGMDRKTRCYHYHGAHDVIALKFKCCGIYYPCYKCHQACADHSVEVWPKSAFHEKAVLCGQCGTELTIAQYLNSGSQCPACRVDFNPGCRNHSPLYFEGTSRHK
ncbi:CHY zinc finger protein [Paludifilum halophilum]|uniref:CHY-type domain-containing protein n=1 Tax=Paludifilum halophilum TaxID=1642702 RepID=A0A235B6A9_9BACL|nr:CHY zinc finger protein [Paludifilum halophilum]OYD07135.1 hypothetical protein CHM34_12120 [Paludifilum halophilum]